MSPDEVLDQTLLDLDALDLSREEMLSALDALVTRIGTLRTLVEESETW